MPDPINLTVGELRDKLAEYPDDMAIFVEVGGDDRAIFDVDDTTNPLTNEGAPYVCIVLAWGD